MKRPEECSSLTDIRTEIDTLDRQLVQLIARRAQYVKAAAKFKSNPQAVADPQRVQSVIDSRKAWAVEVQVDPELIQQLFSTMLSFFISAEMEEWQHRSRPEGR